MSRSGLRFAKSHEWVRVEGSEAVVGLSDYAQGELGDIVFIELPEVGAPVKRGESLTTVESVKSVSEVYAPLSGTITAVNESLDGEPGLINSDAYGEGWILRIEIENRSELDDLFSAQEYEEYTKG
jgi:glycine cleavage system H protein